MIKELEKHMSMKSKRVYGSKGSRGTHVIIEDLNLPVSDTYLHPCKNSIDNVSALELIRSILQTKGAWDGSKRILKEYEDLSFISTIRTSKEDSKIDNNYPNLLEYMFVMHLDDMPLTTISNSVFQVLVPALTNIITDSRYSSA